MCISDKSTANKRKRKLNESYEPESNYSKIKRPIDHPKAQKKELSIKLCPWGFVASNLHLKRF